MSPEWKGRVWQARGLEEEWKRTGCGGEVDVSRGGRKWGNMKA